MKIYEISHKNKFVNKLKDQIVVDLSPQFETIKKLRVAIERNLIDDQELGEFEDFLNNLEETLLSDIEKFKNYNFADMTDSSLIDDYKKHDIMKYDILQNREN